MGARAGLRWSQAFDWLWLMSTLGAAAGVLLQGGWHSFSRGEIPPERLWNAAGFVVAAAGLNLMFAVLKRAMDRSERRLRGDGRAHIGWRLLWRFRWSIFPAPVVLTAYTVASLWHPFDPGSATVLMIAAGAVSLVAAIVSGVRILIDGEV